MAVIGRNFGNLVLFISRIYMTEAHTGLSVTSDMTILLYCISTFSNLDCQIIGLSTVFAILKNPHQPYQCITTCTTPSEIHDMPTVQLSLIKSAKSNANLSSYQSAETRKGRFIWRHFLLFELKARHKSGSRSR